MSALMQNPLIAPAFERIFQRSTSVVGSENNEIAAIQSRRGVDFQVAREIWETKLNEESK